MVVGTLFVGTAVFVTTGTEIVEVGAERATHEVPEALAVCPSGQFLHPPSEVLI